MTQGGVAIVGGRFSVGKALLHALVPVVLLFVAGVAAAASGLFPSAEGAGQVVGFASVFLFPAAFAASWLFQTERRGCGAAVAALLALVVVVLAAGMFTFPLLLRLAPGGLTEAEREFPEIYWTPDGQRYRHPAFGFSLPAPSGRFQEAPAVAEQMRTGLAGIGGYAWAWEDSSTGERIMVVLAKGAGGSRADFDDFTRGMKNEIAGGDDFEVVRDELRWDDGGGDYLLQTLVQETVHFDSRCISGRASRHRPYVACAMTVSGAPTWSRRFLAGLEPAGDDGS